MKALSEQLTDLAARSKKTEDVVAAARDKNRAKLESQRDKLKTSIADGNTRAHERAASAEAKMQQWWREARSSIDAQFATMRAEADERRTQKDVKKAEHHAEQAERDAADAIDWALFVLDQAEYAVIDAVLARARGRPGAERLAPANLRLMRPPASNVRSVREADRPIKIGELQ